MGLQERRRQPRCDRSPHHPFDARRLGLPRRKQDHSIGFQDGANAHRQRLARHASDVAVEQRSAGRSRPFAQRDTVRRRQQFIGGLVEADVAIPTDTERLESDSASVLDQGLIAIALGLQIQGRAIESVIPIVRETDGINQMFANEAVMKKQTSEELEQWLENLKPEDFGKLDT